MSQPNEPSPTASPEPSPEMADADTANGESEILEDATSDEKPEDPRSDEKPADPSSTGS